MTGHDVVPIGVIHTPYTDVGVTPVQTVLNPDATGRAVLDSEFVDGLVELDGFDYLWLLTWLASGSGERRSVELCQTPFLMTTRRRPLGIFAMRGPRRPNPIGLHLVRLTRLGDDGFDFAGVDMIDGTPLLDIKPWVAPLDLPNVQPLSGVRNGWFDEADLAAAHTPNSLAASRGEPSTSPARSDP